MHNAAASDDLAEATRALLLRAPELGALAASETRTNEESYRALVEPSDLQTACEATVSLLLRKLAGIDDPSGDLMLDDIGRRRARQGVGMDAVLRSFRIDFRIVWELLLEERPESADWKAFVVPLWEAVDEISVQVSQAYRIAESEMLGERARDLQALFDELLHGTGPMSAVVRRIASRHGLGDQGRYVLVRVDAGSPSPERALAELGVHSVWLLAGEMLTGIVAVSAPDDERVATCLRSTLVTRAGVSPPYVALEDTRRQVWMADAARDSTPPGSGTVVFLADDPPSAFVGGAPEIAAYLGGWLLSALEPARPQERERLLETVRAYVEGSGSVSATGRALFRHRNTVLNHLRRFEELTGLSLSRPHDIATALLAVRAVGRLR
jgi:PucR C-terminal helix-turn-helix domain